MKEKKVNKIYKEELIMLEGKVLKDFNDKENKLKKYTKGQNFKAEDKRYNELKSKGFVGEGKEVVAKNDK